MIARSVWSDVYFEEECEDWGGRGKLRGLRLNHRILHSDTFITAVSTSTCPRTNKCDEIFLVIHNHFPRQRGNNILRYCWNIVSPIHEYCWQQLKLWNRIKFLNFLLQTQVFLKKHTMEVKTLLVIGITWSLWLML